MSRRPLVLVALLAACSDAGVTKFNAKPTVEISSHATGDTVREGYDATLRGVVGDADDAVGRLAVTWLVGGVAVCPDAAPGPDGATTCDHIFTVGDGDVALEVADPQGGSAVARVTLDVEATDAPTAEISTPETDDIHYSDQGILFSGTVGDGEDAVEDLTVTWETEALGDLGFDVDLSSDGTVETYGRLDEGEHRVRLRAIDSTGKEAIDSVVITVGPPNTEPSCSITAPEEGAAGQQGTEVRFEATVTDPDIANDSLGYAWSSSLDGELDAGNPDSDGTVRFSTDALTVGTHVITLSATDDVEATCTTSLYYTVGTPPVLTLLEPTDGDVVDEGDDVRFSAAVSDSEDQPTDLLVDWISDLDGTISSAGADSTGAVSFRTSALTGGDHAISVTVTDTDGLFTVRTLDLTVNAPPVLSGLGITPDPATNDDTLTCAVTATDSDGTTPSLTYAWTNTATGATLGTSDTLDLAAVGAASNDELACAVTATDSHGSTASDSTTITLSNRAPTLSATLSPSSATAADTLTCTASPADDDGDSLTTVLAWTVGGSSVSATSTSGLSSTLAGAFVYADVVVCTASTDDGKGGTASASDTVTITNSPPTVSSVTLSPTTLQTDDTVTVNASISDPEGDTVTTTYDWLVDGVTVVSGTSSNSLDGASWFDKDDTVTATVIADDGVNTTRETSSSITVDNTPPTAPTVSISPSSPTAGDDLTCSIDTASTDADGDGITYVMSWEVDGVAYDTGGSSDTGLDTADPGWAGPSTTTWTDDTVDGDDVLDGETWFCTATPDDGDDEGTAGTASVTTAAAAYSGVITMPATGTTDGFSSGSRPWGTLNGGGRAVSRIVLTQACTNPKLALYQHASADTSIQGSYYITDASGTTLASSSFATYSGCNDCWLGHTTRLSVTMAAGTTYYLGFQNGTGGDMSGPSIYEDSSARTIGPATFDDPRADKPGGTPRGLPTTTVSWQNRWQVDCQ